MSSTIHPVDEHLPNGKLAALGLQHVLVMYAGAVAVPLIVGRALKLSPQDVAYLISADLFCCGLVTLIQSLGATQWFGIRLPVMMGVTFASVAPMVAMANANPGELGAQLIFGSIIGAGIISILIAPLVSRLLRFFPPVVTGTIIAVIGISLMRIGINWIFGNPFGPTAPSIVTPEHKQWLDAAAAAASAPGSVLPAIPKDLALLPKMPNPKYADLTGVGIAALVLVSIMLIARYAKGFLANISVLLGIVIGGVVATAMGLMNFDKVGKAAWFDVIMPFHFGMPLFDVSTFDSSQNAIVIVAGSNGELTPASLQASDAVLQADTGSPYALHHLTDGALVAVMSHSYSQDRHWLGSVLQGSPLYVGQLGPRERTERLFGFRYRIEIYVPEHLRPADAAPWPALDQVQAKTKQEPVELFHQALENVAPHVEVRSRRVGGATYQVPVEVRPSRRTALAMRWLVDAARKRGFL